MRSDSSQDLPSPSDPADPGVMANPATAAEELDNSALIQQLGQDRIWLLRQIDSGLWSEWRLDLAALERELGQLLDQAHERLIGN